ncbi:MAG TPA: thiamine pyrophosphate-dependent enzyme [Bacteroidales bacterium]|nr:thiamine pyrophosphate-dependent enzyme [Bacteroidales bacterium]
MDPLPGKPEILNDYRIACESRQASLLGRKEVLTGKAKFGIFGDGKEVPQLAMAKVFREGDWRSGYYRDQTFMMAAGMLTLDVFFSQLYGDTDLSVNPASGGRLMNNHFATRSLDDRGNWKDLTAQKNSSADISPTAGQMPRLLGLALASKLFRENPALKDYTGFSRHGDEVAFGTIGDASTSEGHFFEALNAAGVLQVPMAISVWDDGWGISVPKKYQTTKQDISEILAGLEKNEKGQGFVIYREKGWDYAALCRMYAEGIGRCRKEHQPVLFHILELTQPQGHSTSGSHERYKTREQLAWEKEFDCNRKMREWMIASGISTAEELDRIEAEAVVSVKQARERAWKHYQDPIKAERERLISAVRTTHCPCRKQERIDQVVDDLQKVSEPVYKDVISSAKRILHDVCTTCSMKKPMKADLSVWLNRIMEQNTERYGSRLFSESKESALQVRGIPPAYPDQPAQVTGREVLLANFDRILNDHPLVVIFGEDVGRIGGVNQTLEGMQAKYGELRVMDTGIREATIVGQGIGLAMRGFRPIAEIQYFDYLLYGLQVMSDDLATLQYRTKGGQKAPLIISTRGHRLEGIWHSGSPLSMVINSIRGIYVLVPRNMTQAAGFYNTLLASDDAALVIEPLNAYRLKELQPSNPGEYRVPLGVPEVLEEGKDVTLVTYGACVRIAQDAIRQLRNFKISVELIDVQSLLPFDVDHRILESLKKTGRIIFFDEDVPGGATAYMMQKVLEEQGGYPYLDAEPKTITGTAHRPAYGTDGDYFSNPNAEDVFECVYGLMNAANPVKYPQLY